MLKNVFTHISLRSTKKPSLRLQSKKGEKCFFDNPYVEYHFLARLGFERANNKIYLSYKYYTTNM